MSVKYSSSPDLVLAIGKSRMRGVLYGGFCLVTVCALMLLFSRGYFSVVLLLAVPASAILWYLRDDAMVGAELRWHQGLWTLERGGVRRVIYPYRRSTAMPWIICLVFSDWPAGPGRYIWLYADSASRQQLRRLRVRLALLPL